MLHIMRHQEAEGNTFDLVPERTPEDHGSWELQGQSEDASESVMESLRARVPWRNDSHISSTSNTWKLVRHSDS